MLFSLLLVGAGLALTQAFEKPYCQFKSPGYSIEWAYEPNSRNVVFVMKVQSQRPEFWSGVGFSGPQKTVDFVGVLVRNGYVVLADAYVNASGVLYTDMIGNVQTIGYDYDGNTLTAKFARSILSDDVKHDQQLDECSTFLFPNEAGPIQPDGIKPNLEDFSRLQVCDIQKHCSIELSKATVKSKPKLDTPKKDTEEQRFAKSVDVSGKGDPCSFTGENYTVAWSYDKETDRVNFVMKQPIRKGTWWSAVGLGDNMSDMDLAVMFLENGQVKKLGDYLAKGYGPPGEDDQQDWKLESAKKSGKGMEIRFSRALNTDDDKDRTLDKCVLFQFAVNLGKYGAGYSIHKHETWPDLYKACDLTEHCVAGKDAKKGKDKKTVVAEPKTTPALGENNDETTEEHTTSHTVKPTKSTKTKTAAKSKAEDELEGSGQDEVTTHEPELSEGSGEETESTTPEATSTTEAPTTETKTESVATETTVKTKATTTAAPTTTTEEPSSTAKAATTPEAVKSKIPSTCDPLKPDLGVCQSYMDNYLAQVREWAARHDEAMEDQYGKACTLLRAVPHVPTLCCHSFQQVCNAQISRPQ